MIAELGHFALILALCLALVQGIVPLAGAARGNAAWMDVAAPAARAQCVFVALAFLALAHAFMIDDFSVAYVATNGNSALPAAYKLSAVWGAHEGSLLLWTLMLCLWAVGVSMRSATLPLEFSSRVLAVMGLVGAGFLLFMLATSNPFARLVPAAAQGRDLNPLLQDPGLVLHPPILYAGYVGMAVPFAFAMAALLDGRLDATWSRWARPWTLVAWVFLTLGITLGSWWAYYELGWGGWWFWDPVENASFMPWLVATALLHSLAVTDKRGAFRAWTLLLAIFAFSLSLLGTFLVRSGVLVSVHAFAADPARGVFILAFLATVVGAALTLFAWRAGRVSGGGRFEPVSRETLLLVNNVLLATAAGTVLLGTLYPLVMDALDLGKVSVGPPYFNAVFAPLMMPLLALLGLGAASRWKRDAFGQLLRRFRWGAFVAVDAGLLCGTLAGASAGTAAGVALATWVFWTTAQIAIERLRHPGTGPRRLPLALAGMTLAHAGVAVFVVGVVLATAWSQEKDARMRPGESRDLAGYTFRFVKVTAVQGPNYSARRAEFRVARDGREVAVLHPEKRDYASGGMPMTEAGIDAGVLRDLYVALGEPLEDGAWAVRLYHKPFVRWIWIGPLLMALGGVLAAADRRYRRRAGAVATGAVPQAAGA